MLLTADLHLDDKPENDYRWRIFEQLKAFADQEDIYILGDLCDRADRHSAALVNRLVSALEDLVRAKHTVIILNGNHDRPLKGPPFWRFLNHIPHVMFVTEPLPYRQALLLPYSPNPREEWADIDWERYSAVFMHQPVTGVDVGRGQTLTVPDMVDFPDSLRVYSGDIHIPQVVGPVTYVGAPYPVRFGDTHKCRLLLLADDYSIKRECLLRAIRKPVIEVRSIDQLQPVLLRAGDQAKVKFVLSPDSMEEWPSTQQRIIAWARDTGIHIASIEAIVETSPNRKITPAAFESTPEQVLRAYCQGAGVGEKLVASGLDFLAQLGE